MTTTPQFASSPAAIEYAQISTANANRDGSGTLGTVVTGSAGGKRVNRVTVKATVTTTAGMVRFFVSNDNGSTKRLIAEVAVSAITVGAAVAAFEAEVPALRGLVLFGTTQILYAATHNAEAINVIAEVSGF